MQSNTHTEEPSTAAVASAARYSFVIGAVVVGVWIVPAASAVLLVALALISLKDDKSAVQAVTLTWLVTSLNTDISLAPPLSLRWLVLLAAIIGLVRRLGYRGLVELFEKYSGILVVGGVAVASSFVSSFPALAISKFVGFSIGFVLVVGLFGRRRSLEALWLTRWFMGLFWAVVVLSAPLMFIRLGYVVDGVGFQGILNQPQAMGMFLAPYLTMMVLAVVRRGPMAANVAAMVGSATMLYATDARTGMLAVGFGVVVAAIVGLTSKNPEARLRRTERRRGAMMLSAILFAGVLLVSILGTGFVQETLLKQRGGGNAVSIVEEFRSSRGFLVEDSLARFKESPLVGRGFGVPPNVDRADVKTVLGGIPIGASTEPGFAVTGLLEESGILGLIAMSLLLYQVLRPVLRGTSLLAVAVAISALLTNFGEATITSFGGMGLYVWLMVGWALVLSGGRRFVGEG